MIEYLKSITNYHFQQLKKEYREIINDIDYLVIETDSYKELNKLRVKSHNYTNTYIKLIVNIGDVLIGGMKEVFYLKNNTEHNIYDESFIRYINMNINGVKHLTKIASNYSLFGKNVSYDEWKEKSKILRKEEEKLKRLAKLKKINSVSLSISKNF